MLCPFLACCFMETSCVLQYNVYFLEAMVSSTLHYGVGASHDIFSLFNSFLIRFDHIGVDITVRLL